MKGVEHGCNGCASLQCDGVSCCTMMWPAALLCTLLRAPTGPPVQQYLAGRRDLLKRRSGSVQALRH
eukprot:1153447-Pelagomonas_calceolata.AAC.3